MFPIVLRGTVTAYNLTTRAEQWRYNGESNGSAGYQMLVDSERLFVPYLGVGLVALSARDGTETWRTGADVVGAMWRPLVHGPRVYVASRTGLLAFER